MYSFRYFAAVLLLCLISAIGHTQTLPLKNITPDQLSDMVGDLSTTVMHTTVTGAETLGTPFGFEFGLVGSTASTPHLNSLAQSADSTASASRIPSGALFGQVSLPLAITVELGILPSTNISSLNVASYSGALKWTPTDLYGDLPLDLAVKYAYTSTSLNYQETIDNVPTQFNYSNTLSTISVLASKNFGILEPYFSIGYASGHGTLNTTGSTDIFLGLGTISQSNTESASKTGTYALGGVELKLLFFKLGVEYTNALNASRFSGKLSAAF